MNRDLPIIFALLVAAIGGAQERSIAPVDISAEPHHTVVVENPVIRVFRLRLQPDEATVAHRHRNLYAYLSLRSATIAN